MAEVRGVHGPKIVPVYKAGITLNNQNITVVSFVTECDELAADNSVGMLIGMNIIGLGDLHISNFNSTTLSFRVPSLEEVDFVAEISEYNRYLKISQSQIKHGNKKCPCGSGKDYINCHGASKYNR